MVQHSTIDHSGVTSYASNANSVSTANYGGAASTVSRGDHIHLSTAASSVVATDVIWDAAGDLAVGTGANTAAKLTAGAAGGVLAMGNSVVIWNAGTSFPASKATNDRYWRTDLGLEFYWDGTRWVTTTLYREPVHIPETPMSNWSVTASIGRIASWAPTYSVWLVTMDMSTRVNTTNNATHYWTVDLTKYNTAIGGATVVVARATSADTADVVTPSRTAIGAVWDGTTYPLMQCSITPTGSPGGLIAFGVSVSYRIIGT